MINVNVKDIPDQRPTHTLNLLVVEWGHPLQTLTEAYGRRHAEPNTQLTRDDRTKQQQALLILATNQYTNPIDAADGYRTLVVCDTQTFEVINLPVTTSQKTTPLIRFSDVFPIIQSLLPGNFDIPFEDWTHSTVVSGQARPLPLGRLQSLALPYDTYTQILTAGLVKTAYVDSAKLAAGDVESKLSNACSLVHSEGDTNWWTRTGNVFYSPNSADTPAQESAYAAQHFYMVRRFRDAFYSTTSNTEVFVTYDDYDLLVVETVDPYGNRITAGVRDAAQILQVHNDYRVLAPVLVMEPNRNRTAVAYDDLGRLTAQAVIGKPEESLGDTLSSVNLRLSDAATAAYLNNPLANPASVLGSATSSHL
ncbi:hypothetical protein LTS15_010985 [Exophiala xenobiotica]|nr:hypothetical protein LTS15_010985 [Exophiala xenobiotica]